MSDDGCILVVGGTEGIGKELARYYAGTGRETVLTGRSVPFSSFR
jgi:short-subunit dehydrogenase